MVLVSQWKSRIEKPKARTWKKREGTETRSLEFPFCVAPNRGSSYVLSGDMCVLTEVVVYVRGEEGGWGGTHDRKS